MKKLNTLILAGVIALGSAVVGEAQIRTGTQEMSFAGNFSDNDRRNWQVTGFYGYFYNSQLEFVGIGALQGASGQSETGAIGGGADWHFGEGVTTRDFLPFAGASYLIGIGSDVADTLEGHVGLKQFLAQAVAVKYQIGYGVDPSDTGDSTFRATVGLSFFF